MYNLTTFNGIAIYYDGWPFWGATGMMREEALEHKFVFYLAFLCIREKGVLSFEI